MKKAAYREEHVDRRWHRDPVKERLAVAGEGMHVRPLPTQNVTYCG